MKRQVALWLDNMGFSLSFLCAIHCLLFPLLIVALPLFGLSFLLDSFYEKLFLTFSLILASISLVLGYLTHKSFKAIKIYFIASAFLLVGMYGLGHSHSAPELLGSVVATEHAHHDHDHAHHEGHSHDNVITSGIGGQHHHEGFYDTTLILMILGGIALAISHFVNRKLCISCPAHQHEGHCSHS